jgi:hypothetical protein
MQEKPYEKVAGILYELKKNFQKETNNQLSRKRKIEKQMYYPNKKRVVSTKLTTFNIFGFK